MKKKYLSPLFEKFMPQTDDYCIGGSSGILTEDDNSFGGNTGEVEDSLGE